ncbi:hypothetical protein Tco_0172414, partial [Tanacetum coccineum]
MQYEERQGLTQARYDGTTIYEWNIDGQTEYQILNLLQEMTMASNAYKTRNSNEEKIVKVLISGFTGSLKGWWDNYVTDMEKAIICSAKKTIVKVENNVQVQTQEDDMVNTLIYAILKNFVGNPHTYQERSSSILLNLTCRKLSDFRWYKDVFITKVTTRPDCKEAYWKERFIAGLPSLIQESPSTSTSRFTTTSKLSKTNVEIANKIEECQNDEDFARIISQIRSSPNLSEDLFQDSQDLYDDGEAVVENESRNDWFIDLEKTIEANVGEQSLNAVGFVIELIHDSALVNTTVFNWFIELSKDRRESEYFGYFRDIGFSIGDCIVKCSEVVKCMEVVKCREVVKCSEVVMCSEVVKYERQKKIRKELGLDLSVLLPKQDPSLPKKKRKAMELEPE